MTAGGADPQEAGRRLLELLREPEEAWAARDLAAAARTMSALPPPATEAAFAVARGEIDRLCVDLVRHAVRLERRATRLALLGPACRDAGPREPGGGLAALADAARRSALEMAGTLRETVTVAVPRWKAGFDLAAAVRDMADPGRAPGDGDPVGEARARAAALRCDVRAAAPEGATAAAEGLSAMARGIRGLMARNGRT